MNRGALAVLVLAWILAGHARSCLAGTLTWTHLGRESGLPVLRTLSVQTIDGTLYAGTTRGLFRKVGDGRFEKVDLDEIPDTAILCLEADRTTRDLWVGTMHGLARLSQGRVDVFTLFNSGLVNDVVHGLDLVDKHLWIATEAGVSRFEPGTGRWALHDASNSPMKEIWCTGIAGSDRSIFISIWGGGVLEYDRPTGSWKAHNDPDGEPAVDLLRNDGPPSNLVSDVDYDGVTVWVASPFGVASYDGRSWREFFEDSGEGLPSNFVNRVRSDRRSPGRTRPERVWACTDRGLGCFDGKTWTHELTGVQVHSVAFEGDTVVAATDDGVYVGTPAKAGGSRPDPAPPASPAPAGKAPQTPRGQDQARRFFGPHGLYLPPSSGPDDEYKKGIPIGLISYDERHPWYYLSVQAERAMELAIEEENTRDGRKDNPYRMVVERMAPIWGPASNGAVSFADRDRAVFFVSSLDVAATLPSLRLGLKIGMPVISTLQTDAVVCQTRIPWHVRVNCDDSQYARALVDHVITRLGRKRVGLVRVNGAYGRSGSTELGDDFRRLGHPIALEVTHEQRSEDLDRQAEAIRKANLDAVVIWSDARDAGNLVRAIRGTGFSGPVFGSDRVVSEEFLKTAREAAEGVVAVTDYDPSRKDPELWRFQRAYMKRYWERPEAAAARTYAAMRLAFDAIRRVGLRRRPLMEELLKLEGRKVPTVLGTLELDSRLQNVSPVVWARVVKGKFQYSSAPPGP